MGGKEKNLVSAFINTHDFSDTWSGTLSTDKQSERWNVLRHPVDGSFQGVRSEFLRHPMKTDFLIFLEIKVPFSPR